MFISVVICTIGRKSLVRTILSIYENTFKNFEVIVVSQVGKESILRDLLEYNLVNSKLRLYKITERNLSKARNYAILKARGDILAFTDDDCVVDKNWLSSLSKSFESNKEIVCVVGNTLPFTSSQPKNIIVYCPSTFMKGEKVIQKPSYHTENIGFGNNMAFRKQVFENVGHFKTWLGVGSVGLSAEDAEMFLRILVNDLRILHSPKMIVYHDRWLDKNKFIEQMLQYKCGELACYGYYAFHGYKIGKDVVLMNISELTHEIKLLVKRALLFKKDFVGNAYYLLKSITFKLRGLSIAKFYSLIE